VRACVRSTWCVGAAGRELCRGWCRHCEVSAALNHRVDELLVDIVTAVRQRHQRATTDTARVDSTARSRSPAAAAAAAAAAGTCLQDSDTSCVRSAAIMLKGLFTKHKSPPASKSCENLIDWWLLQLHPLFRLINSPLFTVRHCFKVYLVDNVNQSVSLCLSTEEQLHFSMNYRVYVVFLARLANLPEGLYILLIFFIFFLYL